MDLGFTCSIVVFAIKVYCYPEFVPIFFYDLSLLKTYWPVLRAVPPVLNFFPRIFKRGDSIISISNTMGNLVILFGALLVANPVAAFLFPADSGLGFLYGTPLFAVVTTYVLYVVTLQLSTFLG